MLCFVCAWLRISRRSLRILFCNNRKHSNVDLMRNTDCSCTTDEQERVNASSHCSGTFLKERAFASHKN